MTTTRNNTPTHYETLGVARTADIATIKKAYRQLALTWHPDKYEESLGVSREQAAEKFKVIGSAYEILGNEGNKALYDYELARPQPYMSYYPHQTANPYPPRRNVNPRPYHAPKQNQNPPKWFFTQPNAKYALHKKLLTPEELNSLHPYMVQLLLSSAGIYVMDNLSSANLSCLKKMHANTLEEYLSKTIFPQHRADIALHQVQIAIFISEMNQPKPSASTVPPTPKTPETKNTSPANETKSSETPSDDSTKFKFNPKAPAFTPNFKFSAETNESAPHVNVAHTINKLSDLEKFAGHLVCYEMAEQFINPKNNNYLIDGKMFAFLVKPLHEKSGVQKIKFIILQKTGGIRHSDFHLDHTSVKRMSPKISLATPKQINAIKEALRSNSAQFASRDYNVAELLGVKPAAGHAFR